MSTEVKETETAIYGAFDVEMTPAEIAQQALKFARKADASLRKWMRQNPDSPRIQSEGNALLAVNGREEVLVMALTLIAGGHHA